MINFGNRSQSKYAVAPGVITNAITKNAPTVCIAATTEADSNIKNIVFSSLGRRPIVSAWVS